MQYNYFEKLKLMLTHSNQLGWSWIEPGWVWQHCTTFTKVIAWLWPWSSGNTNFKTYLFHGIFQGLSIIIFKYSNEKYSNIRTKNIRIFEPKIFEYSYSVYCSITNIFVFVFGQKYDSEYIRIRIRAKKNIPNIFVFVFGPKKNIRYALWYSCKKVFLVKHF